MTKRLLISSLFLITLFAAPLYATPVETEIPAIEQSLDEDVKIAVSGQMVTVNGAQGQTLEVVSLTGRRVLTLKIDSPSQRIELNIPKGCYILKVGKVVRKVSVH